MQVVRPVHEDHPLWYTDRVPLPEGALFYVAQHSTAGSGVNTSESTLDLRQVLRQLPHHNRPGGRSPILGILFNYAFQVDLRSVFGYMLGRVLSPNYSNGWRVFVQHFVSILAWPRYYDEAIVQWNQTNPGRPFTPVVPGSPLTI